MVGSVNPESCPRAGADTRSLWSSEKLGWCMGLWQAGFTSQACSRSFHVKPDLPTKRCLLLLPWLLGSQSSGLGLHLPYSTARGKDLQGLCALRSATEMSSSFLWHRVDSALVASG